MQIAQEHSFNHGVEVLQEKHPDLLEEVREIILNIDVSDCRVKKSRETTKDGKLLYSPIAMNAKFKHAFGSKGWDNHRRVKCEYTTLGEAPDLVIDTISSLHSSLVINACSKTKIKEQIDAAKSKIPKDLFKTLSSATVEKRLSEQGLIHKVGHNLYTLDPDFSAEELIECVTPDFTGFREMDAVKDKIGVEVQFGKYAFMVYNVCAKMTIFNKREIIDYGIEIVPVKSLQRDMSTGVAFYEQFIWDLNERGVSNLDIPVLIIGIDA